MSSKSIIHDSHTAPAKRSRGAHAGRRRRIMFVEAAAAMGGVEWSTLYLAKRLDPARWKPLVVCPGEGDLPQACRAAGIEVQIAPRGELRSTSIRLGSRFRLPNPLSCGWDVAVALRAARNLRGLVAARRPDVIVTKGLFAHFYGALAARRSSIPCVWHVQDFISERWFGMFRRVFGQAARWLPTHIVADGGPIVGQLPCELQSKTDLIPNGIDVQTFRPGLDGAELRQELGVPREALVIGHVARITPWKGQRLLLEAFARLAARDPRPCLLFVGSCLFDRGDYERQLRRRTTELGLGGRVFYAGYRSDLPRVLAAMDVFAYPSLEKDTTPLALLSAMAAGLPVVAFDIEGVREVLGDSEHGLLAPVADVGRLTEALKRVSRDDELRSRLACGARRRVEQEFSLERHVRRFEEVFLKLLENP